MPTPSLSSLFPERPPPVIVRSDSDVAISVARGAEAHYGWAGTGIATLRSR